METATKSNSLSAEKNNLCRACLSANEDNNYIFACHANIEHQIHSPTDLCEKLQFYGGIEVTEFDGLPGKMCNECIFKMRMAHEFRTQCQATDKILRSITIKSENKNSSTLRIAKGVNEIKILEDHCDDESNAAVKTGIYARLCQKPESETSTCVKKVDTCVFKKMNNNARDKSVLRANSRNKEVENTLGANKDKLASKKDEYRSQRLILFKRATSMNNLKNNKERQRRYIKKGDSLFTKLKSSYRDNVENRETTRDVVRQLAVDASPECGGMHSTKTALDENFKEVSCDGCDEKFSRIADSLKQAKTHEPNEKLKPASCKICNKKFRKAVTMVRHLNVHKRENPRAVYIILKDIRDRRKGGKNIENEANENFEDNAVVLRNGRESREVEKMTSESEGSRDCVREMRNTSSEGADFHKKHASSHKKKKYTCNICDGECHVEDDVEDRRKHRSPSDERSAIELINIWIKEELDSDNEAGGKGFPCGNCSKSYATKKSLLKHREKMHATVIADYCPRCGEHCVCGRGQQQRHEIQENNKESTREKLYACEECNKSFEKEAKLEKHMTIHARAKEQQDANFKRFLCHICSKTFRQNTGLVFHMRTHTGYKPHVCKYCGRGFTSNSNCINHERTHTGDRPFVCHFCSAAFAKSCTLKAHITTHTGEANYHCKTCGKSFRRLKYLKEHRFTHTGEKPYACKICGTAYSHSGSLFVHEKKCKNQEGAYQTVSVPTALQNYRQQPFATTVQASTIAPTITLSSSSSSSSSSHRVNSMDNSSTVDASEHYVENFPRINNSVVNDVSDGTGVAHIQLNTGDTLVDVPSVVRSFTVVGQMFQN